MMKTDAVIEGLNRSLCNLREYRNIKSTGHFVLVREKNIPSTFTKAIKEYISKLYFIKGKNTYLIIEKSYMGKATTEDQEDNCRREVDIMLIQDLFFLMNQVSVMDIIIDGKYEELQETWQQVQTQILTKLSSRKNS